ncbi:MAG TPA: fibronectin type III domain-containing protein [Anaerolineae bacterium]|nr:fibronectin type III domain-containing protein [Anaerolineae bacterium]
MNTHRNELAGRVVPRTAGRLHSSKPIKRALWLGSLISALLIFTLALNAGVALAADRTFSLRYDVLQQGANLAQIGNMLMTCSGDTLKIPTLHCSDVQVGNVGDSTTWYNDRFSMIFVDVDGDSSTWNSSTATLSIPTGVEVLRAQLYWGGSVNGSDQWNDNVPTSVKNPSPGTYANVAHTMKFKGPTGIYQNVTADQFDFEDITVGDNTGTPYGATADITTLFNNNPGWTSSGGGTFTGANVIATRGCTSGSSCSGTDSHGDGSMGNYAGWALLLVYRNPADNVVRYVGIDDGFKCVIDDGSSCPQSLSLNFTGFNVPQNTTGSRWGILGWDGDQGTGDHFYVQDLNTPQNLPNTHPSTNFFRSRISLNDTVVTTRNPNHVITFGEDLVDSNSVTFAGGTTSVPAKFDTAGELVVLHYFWLVTETTATDYGDAPTSYGIVSHDISTSASTLRMGAATTDPEAGMQNTGGDATTALGDDTHGTDDEDGVSWNITSNTVDYTLTILVKNTFSPSATANLYCWIDTNNNGTFDFSEARTATIPGNTAQQLVTLTWAGVGPKAANTVFYLRCRVTTNNLTDNGSGTDSRAVGSATNGEVEDHRLVVSTPPTATLFKKSSATVVNDGIRISWQTGSELNVIGFNVLRSANRNTGYTQVNGAPINAKHPGMVNGAQYAYLDTNALKGKLFYRIEAVTTNGKELSEPLQVTAPNACSSAPAKPDLTAPANKATVNTRRANLQWQVVACAKSYKIEVREGNKSGALADQANDLKTTQFTTKRLKAGQTYVWRVQACNGKGCIPSAWRSFQISK